MNPLEDAIEETSGESSSTVPIAKTRPAPIPFKFLRNSIYLDELTPELAVAAASGELLSAIENHAMSWAPGSDQAAAITAAITTDWHLGATNNMVSPEPNTYDDLARVLSQATGKQITHRQAPAAQVVQVQIDGSMDDDHARSTVTDSQGAIAGGKCRTIGDDIQRLSGRGRPTPDYLATPVHRAHLTR